TSLPPEPRQLRQPACHGEAGSRGPRAAQRRALGALHVQILKRGSLCPHLSAAAALRRPPPARASNSPFILGGSEDQFLLVVTRAAGLRPAARSEALSRP